MKVRKGFTVLYGARMFPSGTIIPINLENDKIILNQSWELEDLDNGAENINDFRGEESEEKQEQPKEKEDKQEEKEVIKDIAVDRMMKSKKIKKKR